MRLAEAMRNEAAASTQHPAAIESALDFRSPRSGVAA